MRDLDAVTVDAGAAASIRTGLPLDRVPLGAEGEGPWATLDASGDLLAGYEATGERPHPAGRGSGRRRVRVVDYPRSRAAR